MFMSLFSLLSLLAPGSQKPGSIIHSINVYSTLVHEDSLEDVKLKCMKCSEFSVVSNRNQPWPISGGKENNILKSHWVAHTIMWKTGEQGTENRQEEKA